MRSIKIFSVLCVCLSALNAQTTYYVNNLTGLDSYSGVTADSAKMTVQSAIDAAASGDTISITATEQVYEGMAIVAGKTLMFAASGGVPEIAGLMIHQPSLEYEVRLAATFKVDSVVFVNGLIVTGNDTLIMNQGEGYTAQGFDRSQVTGGRISHVVGNVKKVVRSTRNEFPVGSDSAYRPVAITFYDSVNVAITVSHINEKPVGLIGLPIGGTIAPTVEVGRYPDFFWHIRTSASLGIIPSDLELSAEKFSDFDEIEDLRIIRRAHSATDVHNPWTILGLGYENYLIGGVLTVLVKNTTGAIIPLGAMFTYGLKSRMAVANPFTIPTLTNSYPIHTQSLANPSLVAGNAGKLSYTATTDHPTIVMATVINDVLIVTGLHFGATLLRITATDLYGGERIIYKTAITSQVWILDCYPSSPPYSISKNIAFGSVRVGEYKDTTFTISTLCYPRYISDIISTNSDFNVTSTSGTLTSLSVFEDTIRFTPSITGGISGEILVKIASSQKPDTIKVSGVGVEPQIVHVSSNNPLSFSLSQNYPNPFNPSTVISFQLPVASYAELVIYDALGREIETLVSEQLSSGSYSVNWDASGRAAGMYYYRLRAGEFVETKKLILLK